jgi:hypothetical protein
MNEQAIQARREYYKRWREGHKENVQQAQMRYWTRRAARENPQGNTAQEKGGAASGS